MSVMDRLRWLLITSGGLGLSPFASGTVGTLGGVALAVVLQAALPDSYLWWWGGVALALFVWGCLQTQFVARTWPKEDPGQFVLDEVVGYLVTVFVYTLLAGQAPGPWQHTAAFFAFRFFDVAKIQPARRLEDLPGALGIMADDQVAGAYAGLAIWLVLPLLGW